MGCFLLVGLSQILIKVQFLIGYLWLYLVVYMGLVTCPFFFSMFR